MTVNAACQKHEALLTPLLTVSRLANVSEITTNTLPSVVASEYKTKRTKQ